MFSERDRARPEPLKPETRSRTVDRDWALTFGSMLCLLGAAGDLCAMVSAMTLDESALIAAYSGGLIAFLALAGVFELIGRVRQLERRLNARERLDRVTR